MRVLLEKISTLSSFPDYHLVTDFHYKHIESSKNKSIGQKIRKLHGKHEITQDSFVHKKGGGRSIKNVVMHACTLELP